MDLVKLRFIAAALCALASGAAGAQGADVYPSKPIRVIVPTVAGGALDNVARLLAARMSERLGQSSSWRTAAARAA